MRAIPLVVALVIAIPSTSASQVVLADIHVGSGPVQGRIVVGYPRPYYAAPVVVSRYHAHRHVCRPVEVRHGYYGHGRPHRVSLWYHPATGRYYDHPHPDFRGVRQVSVWEGEGRHWRDD